MLPKCELPYRKKKLFKLCDQKRTNKSTNLTTDANFWYLTVLQTHFIWYQKRSEV